MSRIRGRDTRPELAVRRALRDAGVGYRLHARDLPGSPDIVMRGKGVAVFVHGCFWHRHPGCRKASQPKSSCGFWQDKFDRNVARDARDRNLLVERGWTVVVVWECEVRSNLQDVLERILSARVGGRRIRRLRPPSKPRSPLPAP